MAVGENTNIRQNFDNPDETRPFEKGRAEVVEVSGLSVMRARLCANSWTPSMRRA